MKLKYMFIVLFVLMLSGCGNSIPIDDDVIPIDDNTTQNTSVDSAWPLNESLLFNESSVVVNISESYMIVNDSRFNGTILNESLLNGSELNGTDYAMIYNNVERFKEILARLNNISAFFNETKSTSCFTSTEPSEPLIIPNGAIYNETGSMLFSCRTLTDAFNVRVREYNNLVIELEEVDAIISEYSVYFS